MLTNLHDRDAFQQALAETRKAGPVTLALLDIDNFSTLNDKHGRKGGDAALQRVENTLLAALPYTAIATRLGGDEFAVLLPDAPAETALILMEQIRTQLATPKKGAQPRELSTSIGIATHPMHTAKRTQLMAAADEALLRAKRDGRGRVAIYVEERMVLKSNYYTRASLERLSKLAETQDRTEASLLREALDRLIEIYRDPPDT